MNCNRLGSLCQTSLDGCVFVVGSLAAALAKVQDHRKRRSVRFALSTILLVMVLAKLAGEDKATGIAEWARAEWLLLALGLKRQRLPNRSTYSRVLAKALQVDDLERVVGEFLTQQPTAGKAVVISLDGTLRACGGRFPPGKPRACTWSRRPPLGLAASLPEAGVVLLHVEVGAKENEFKNSSLSLLPHARCLGSI